MSRLLQVMRLILNENVYHEAVQAYIQCMAELKNLWLLYCLMGRLLWKDKVKKEESLKLEGDRLIFPLF